MSADAVADSDVRSIPKIDVHAHLFSRGAEPADREMEDLVRLARRANIGRVMLLGNVVMGWPEYTNPEPDAVSAINTHTMVALARYPELFLGFCFLNPANPADFNQEEIERRVVQEGMRGIKLWVCVKATDRRVDPIMERAQALGVPVLHHSWYNQGEPTGEESIPAEVAALGRRFPKVTIIMAHLGGGGCRGVLDIVDVPNVHVDTAGSQPEAGLVDYAVQHLGAERVVFGSDWPVRDIAVQVGRVAGASLTAEQRHTIYRRNAARILGLEDVST